MDLVTQMRCAPRCKQKPPFRAVSATSLILTSITLVAGDLGLKRSEQLLQKG